MAILKIESQFGNDIIKSIIPKELIDNGVVIAGGFPLAVFIESRKTIEEFHKTEFLKMIKNNFKNLKYGDVDLWLIEDSEKTEKYILLDELSKLKNGQILKVDKTKDLDDALFNCIKSSKYASTFHIPTKRGNHYAAFKLQVMKKKVKSVINAIEDFDLNICKIAWSNNIFYVDESVITDYKNQTLSPSDSLKLNTNSSKEGLAYNSLRYLKYCNRYSLEPAKELYDYIIHSFLTCYNNTVDELDRSKNGKTIPTSVPLIPNVLPTSNSHYIESGINLSTLAHDLVSVRYLEQIVKFKNSDKSFLTYLVNERNYKHILREYFENHKESNYETTSLNCKDNSPTLVREGYVINPSTHVSCGKIESISAEIFNKQ